MIFKGQNRFFFSWERFPALFIFASLVSGALLFHGAVAPLFFSLTHKKHSYKLGYLCLAIFTALLFFIDQNEKPTDKQTIKAYVQPLKITKSNNRLYLRAHIPYLKTIEGKEYRKISCIIPLFKKSKPIINSDFIVEGIIKKSSYGYFLQPKKWKAVHNTFSFVEDRFNSKNYAKKIIHKQNLDKDVTSYFDALVTGDISDPFLRQRFLACGMLHTLAISGFHFSWIVFLLSIPLSIVFRKKTTLCLLLLLAWGYFFYIGPTSSISRAWIAVSIYLLSIIFCKIPLPLNALGLAGICSIIIDPYSVFTLSFILSFLATFCILTLHNFISSLVGKLSPKRNKKDLQSMSFIDKNIYYLLKIFLNAFFLSLFIQVILLPVFCFYFPFISLWGLFYNIFFPLSMIPTLILLLFAFLLHSLIPTTLIWKINALYSKPFLETILYGKGSAALLIKLPNLNLDLLSAACCICIFFCMTQEKLSHEEYLIQLDEFSLT